MRRMEIYIHQQDHWPDFTWDHEQLAMLLGKVRNEQGKLVGKMASLGFDLQHEAFLETFTLNIIKTTEIEGIILNPEQVRSSAARRLGIDVAGLTPSDRNIDGVVDMMFDATRNFNQPLTKERLFDWHYSLFPTGRSGVSKISVGDWRDDSTGPMQVVSGAIGKENVHYQAPAAARLAQEMNVFIEWINEGGENIDLVLKAGIAHLWFVTLHPFDDGNGRIARAITDMLLAKSDGSEERFYSMSAQIQKEHNMYYAILEKTQKGNLDITEWLSWFLTCLLHALNSSHEILSNVIYKHNFWNMHSLNIRNERQKLLVNKLLDGFYGKLTTSDTALRDIQDLMRKNILRKAEGGGRSTSYELVDI